MNQRSLAEFVQHYLTELRGDNWENAFHSLIEADHAIIPLLIAEFNAGGENSYRIKLLEIIAEHRWPEAIPFFAAQLEGEYWKIALECLLLQSSPSIIEAIQSAMDRRVGDSRNSRLFRDHLAEALEFIKSSNEPEGFEYR